MRTETETVTLQLNVEGNLGYAPEQIDNQRMTVGEMLEALTYMAEEYGEDAFIVLHQTNNRYGANYGGFDRWGDLFQVCADNDTDEEE